MNYMLDLFECLALKGSHLSAAMQDLGKHNLVRLAQLDEWELPSNVLLLRMIYVGLHYNKTGTLLWLDHIAQEDPALRPDGYEPMSHTKAARKLKAAARRAKKRANAHKPQDEDED